MRKLFKGYYRPGEENFKKMWSECIFVFDTNVLLNLYRYKKTTQETLLRILEEEEIKNRVFLPYQAAYEYHKNRVEVISIQEKSYSDIIDTVDKSLNKLIADLNGYKRHPLININEIIDRIELLKEDIQKDMEMYQKDHPQNLMFEDFILERVSDIFDGKVGNQLDTDQKVLERRFNDKIPPGYKDSGKNNGNKYGDVILWLQVIEKAKEINKPILLITDDTKEDWWWKAQGKILGPRPELIQEMENEANVDFYMYQTDTFIKYAQQYLIGEDEENTEEAIEEIRIVRAQDEISQKDKEMTAISSNILKDYNNLGIINSALNALNKSGVSPEFLNKYSNLGVNSGALGVLKNASISSDILDAYNTSGINSDALSFFKNANINSDILDAYNNTKIHSDALRVFKDARFNSGILKDVNQPTNDEQRLLIEQKVEEEEGE